VLAISLAALSATGLYGWLTMGALTPLQVLFGSLVVPIWIGIYCFLPVTMADLFNRLRRNDVVGEYRADRPPPLLRYQRYRDFAKRQADLIGSPWWAALAGGVVALYWLVTTLVLHDNPITQATSWVQPIMVIVYSFVLYMGTLSIVWIVCIVVATNRLFHVFKIHVRPLHPDGSGGLGVFDHFLWISIALVMIGVLTALSVKAPVLDPAYILAGIVCYLIALPLLLIAWLAVPHHVMVEARDELLRPLSNEYAAAVEETMPLVHGRTATITGGTARLAALQARYEQLKSTIPTWPIEIKQLGRMATILILPALLAILPSLFTLLTGAKK
jgi:hypothetical protein